MINEIVKLYNEGFTARQAIHRGVGQQAQRLEKSMYWEEVADAIETYNAATGNDVSVYHYKKHFDDGSVLEFMADLAVNIEYDAKQKDNSISDFQLDSLILSKLLMYILEVR